MNIQKDRRDLISKLESTYVIIPAYKFVNPVTDMSSELLKPGLLLFH